MGWDNRRYDERDGRYDERDDRRGGEEEGWGGTWRQRSRSRSPHRLPRPNNDAARYRRDLDRALHCEKNESTLTYPLMLPLRFLSGEPHHDRLQSTKSPPRGVESRGFSDWICEECA